MADITLTYKGDTIAELSESGSKTLETAGKYCEADILLEYVKSGGGVPSCVSELSGGSFTPAANIRCNAQQIPHGLQTTPKGFFIWSEDAFTESSSDTSLFFVTGYFSKVDTRNSSGAVYGFYAYQYYRQSDYRVSINNGVRNAAQTDTYITPNYICMYDASGIYQSGKTYKWLAWA